MKFLRSYATETTRRSATQADRQVAELQAELEIARRELVVVEAERDQLAAVCARNVARIQSESAAAAQSRAQHEGNIE